MALHVVRLTVLLTVFACSVSLQAQVGSSIQGKVTNTSGAVIPGVQVSIKDLTSNDVRLVVTNTAGGFSASYLRPGPYQLKASKPGFATVTINTTLGIGAQRVVDLRLPREGEGSSPAAASVASSV